MTNELKTQVKLDIYSLKDELKWKSIIKESIYYDFYHTYHYHNLAFKNGEGIPRLFVYCQDNNFIALPLLERKIDGLLNYVDYTSVYGYVGPISNCKPSENLIENFSSALNEFFISTNTVSVFSRLHPLIEQSELLKKLGSVDDLSYTVTIDLNLSTEEQKKFYRKSNKYEINQLRKFSNLKFSNNKTEIDSFIAIYLENMARVNAHERYLFNKEYFYDFLNSEEYETKILIAYDKDIPMAGAMFVCTNGIVQYHLAGTSKEYLDKTPMKLILDEMRCFSTEHKFNFLHLGGGVGNSRDSLFNFKAGFSKRIDQFRVWRYIVNQNIYDELVEKNKNSILNCEYFPEYRG